MAARENRPAAASRSDRLRGMRLYLVIDSTPKLQPLEAFLEAALDAGVDMLQLRERRLDDRGLLAAARRCSATCSSRGVPFIVNDRLDVALLCGADGLHVGQDDLPVDAVRSLAPPGFIIGLSTHDAAQIESAARTSADYIGVGPVHATPTKLGRPAVGAGLVRTAAQRAVQPFFAIGGMTPETVGEVVTAGACAVSVLRYIAEADEPGAAVRAILTAMDKSE